VQVKHVFLKMHCFQIIKVNFFFSNGTVQVLYAGISEIGDEFNDVQLSIHSYVFQHSGQSSRTLSYQREYQ
jgi:hypothetical protein